MGARLQLQGHTGDSSDRHGVCKALGWQRAGDRGPPSLLLRRAAAAAPSCSGACWGCLGGWGRHLPHYRDLPRLITAVHALQGPLSAPSD